MALSIHQLTIPPLVRGLGILAGLLRKGEAHAAATGGDPSMLVQARLAPDMLTLAGQVQRASDTAKLTASRLTATQAPPFPDEETNFAELQVRIAKTVSYLEQFTEAQFADAETRAVTLGTGESARHFIGNGYVLTFALPNFYFHVTTAYDILRHQGVALSKRDYLWLND